MRFSQKRNVKKRFVAAIQQSNARTHLRFPLEEAPRDASSLSFSPCNRQVHVRFVIVNRRVLYKRQLIYLSKRYQLVDWLVIISKCNRTINEVYRSLQSQNSKRCCEPLYQQESISLQHCLIKFYRRYCEGDPSLSISSYLVIEITEI